MKPWLINSNPRGLPDLAGFGEVSMQAWFTMNMNSLRYRS